MASDEGKLLKKKTKYANDDNYLALAETCQLLGELYKDREEHQRALNEYKLAAKAYEKLNKSMDRGLAFRMIGEMHLMMGQFEEALQNVQAYMRAAKKEVNKMELHRANVTLGRVYLHRAECLQAEKKSSEAEADLIAAEKAFNTGLSICNELQGTVAKTEITEMQAVSYLNLGVTLDHRGKTEIAKDHMERAIRLARAADLFELLHTCYNTMALCSSKWEGNGGSEACGKTLRFLNHGLEVASRLSNRASKMCQTLLLKAKFFLQMGDFLSARQTLKRAYHLKTPVTSDAKHIAQLLKILVALCRTEDELISIEATNYQRRKTLYERMGDGACKLRNFPKAIDCYRRMLECAEALGDTARQLLPCYVSLYQTYTDNRQYELAVEYLWKEYEIIADDPKEAYHTLLQIAKLYERQNKSFFDTEDIYQKARAEAKKLRSVELERVPVQRAIKLLRANCMDMMADNITQEALGVGIDLTVAEPDSEELPDVDEVVDVALEDEEEQNTPNVGDEINLDIDLSDNSDVEGEANLGGGIGGGKILNNSDSTRASSTSGQPRTRKRGMTFAVRRNNKGETQLHQASISGNRVLVERLLAQGHPVNVRDHAGWLPLHEACIHGHAEIVTALLDSGAHLNDKGGTSCDGITPLYDACCNGRLDVIEVLLDRGANATQLTDFGDSTLNILDTWHAKCKNNISSVESTQYKRIRERLVTKFDAAAIQVTSPTVKSSKGTNTLSLNDKRSTRRTLSSNELASPSVSPPSNATSPKIKSLQWTSSGSSGYGIVKSRVESSVSARYRNTDSEASENENNDASNDGASAPAGVSEYRSAMKALRKNTNTDQEGRPFSLSTQKNRLAHLTLDEVDADDWLIDDMQQPAKKRSRVSRDLHRTSFGSLQRRKSSVSLDNRSSPIAIGEDTDDEYLAICNEPPWRCNSLLDGDDDDTSHNDFDESSDLQRNRNTDAHKLLMKNSAKSFRRTAVRQRSSEPLTSLKRRHARHGQTSLLDAGFQCASTPFFDEEESLISSDMHPTTSAKPSSTPASPKQPPPAETSAALTFDVMLDDGEKFSLSYEDHQLLNSLTIGWLQNEVVKRYMLKRGRRPKVKLRPSENCNALGSFSCTDPLNVLTKDGSLDRTSLYGQVFGYEPINFKQFYNDYCEEHNMAYDKNVVERLVKMESKQSIILQPDFIYTLPSKLASKTDTLSTIFRFVFFQQDFMNHLDLSMNCLTDKDIKQLVGYLPFCHNLRVLRLGMNLLTSCCVEMLCYGIKDSTDDDSASSAVMVGGLRGSLLEELDLSHNSLKDAAVASLHVLCNGLSKLRILRLRATDITAFGSIDEPGFDISRLETFDISENELTEQSIQCLFQHLVEDRLREGHFHSLAFLCSDFKPKLWQTISSTRLAGLKVLNLINCRLSDDELENKLLPGIGLNCEKLTHLDLSMNLALTKRSFLALFRQCNGAVHRLEQVRFVHDVELWVDIDTMEQTDQLLKFIEFNPSSHYPQEIQAMLPVCDYTSERSQTLLTMIESFWRALWPLRRSIISKHANGINVTLSVD